MFASPVTAQKIKVQEIECTKLTLIDPVAGIKTAELTTGKHGGLLYLFGSTENRGAAKLYADKEGGELVIFSNERAGENHISASIRTTKDGAGAVKINHRNGAGVFIVADDGTGAVKIDHKNGGGVFIATTDIGGSLQINGPNHNKSLALIGVSDDGKSGLIKASRNENGMRVSSAELKADKNGGRLDVFGRVDNKSRAAVSINEHGSGAVSTWDKNLYRR